MTSEIGVRSIDYSEELGGSKDVGHWLREQRRQESASERDRGLDILRSGSAPPTVEGSLTAVGGLFSHHGDVWSAPSNKREISEDELRSDPAYINYYFSHVNLNPRLPPPLLSKEDWRTAQRLSGGGGGVGGSVMGGIGDMRKSEVGSNNSMFSAQLGFSGEKDEREGDYRNGQNEWGGDGLIGLPGLGLGSGQKSIADILQDDLNHTAISKHPSLSASRNSIDEGIVTSESQYAQLEHDISSAKLLRSASKNSGSASHSYASAVGAPFARSSSTDPHLIARAPSPRVPPVGEGRVNSFDKRAINGPTLFNDISGNTTDSADLAAALSGMNLAGDCMSDEEKRLRSQFQQGINDHQNMYHLQGDNGHLKKNLFLNPTDSRAFQQSMSQSPKGSYSSMSKSNGLGMDRNNYYMRADGQVNHLKHSGSCSPSNYHSIGSPSSSIPNYSLSGPNMNPALASMMAGQLGNGNMPFLYENSAGSHLSGGGSGLDSRVLGGGLASGANYMAAATELQNLGRAGNQQVIDPMYLQYLKSAELASSQYNDNAMDLLALQKAYMGSLLSPTKSNCGGHYLGKSGGFNPGYYGNQALALEMAYGGNPLINSLLPNSPVGPGSPMRQSDRNMRLAPGMRNLAAGGMGAWRSEAGGINIMDQCFSSSLLDEFKSNKTKCFELSEIATHVVEFSADQYGSRFIQQKLETATTEEKTMVFHEILPHALALMTDVFGNYVIQKFFEHGTPAQIRELANKLTGHVLTLSLQMYGCRVIQKAIEVVDLDQQKKMVIELDGNIMRCVRDQNGNHVIQKCIECIPEDAIHFIVSTFYEQVVILSTHPYGCRVIQRVLEHCHDPKTQEIVMDEIMQSVCMLAQDQYGNYVVQHVLEHGKPEERSAIIIKLTGKIVQMSQQKFASNVVEKCLSFGDPVERRAIITEMLGTTDENEPLQAMMKDQFGNYVVQKVLETCDEQQLEMILMRIKIHLNALKKYTYGKHIVARVEKLVAAGERRIVMQASYGGGAAA